MALGIALATPFIASGATVNKMSSMPIIVLLRYFG
jgi:hypothetical protein